MSLIDKLPKIFPFINKSQKDEYFFALNINAETVEAAIWGVEGHRLSIINIAKSEYSDHEDLVEAANASLDKVSADFTPEPAKILFGVPESWLRDDDLKDEYSKLLKKLVEALDVEPLAYVSTSHAISHFLQKEQGIPVTSILVGLSDPLIITVVKASKIVAEKEVKRSGSLAADIEKGLLSITDVEVLPSKILLYNNLDSQQKEERIKDELLSFAWMQNLPFLHLPKIEILPQTVSLFAVCLAGAAEINPAAHLSRKELDVLTDKLLKKELTSEEEFNEDKAVRRKQDSRGIQRAGFISGDIEEFEENLRRDALTPIINQDQKEENYGQMVHETAKDIEVSEAYHNKKALFRFGRLVPKFVPVALLFLLIIVIAAAYIVLPKAKVTIFVDPKILEKDAQVTVDPAINSVDEANHKIPGQIVDTTLTGSEKGTTSGKKKIGDRSKGTVVIYNKTFSSKTFSEGTSLSSDNIKFVLDSTVSVASQSAVEGGIAFGKGTATLTASDIGPEGNLPAGKELSIANLATSDFSAKVDSVFSGGTSKEVTVVTNDDQKKLLALTMSNLRKQAQSSLQSKLAGDSKVLEETLTEDIKKQSFSKNVNDQAQEFSLNLTVHYKGTAYSDADLKTMVAKLVETNIPEGFMLNLSDIETQAEVAKAEKDGRLIFLAKFRAKLRPKLDEEKIKKDIKGKTPLEVAIILKNTDNVISSEIAITPALPAILQRLPFLTKNISIEVTTK